MKTQSKTHNERALAQFDLTGCVALITGAGRGLGRAMAIGLSEAGASVVVAGRNAADLEETVTVIKGSGGEASSIVFEATISAEVTNMVAAAHAAFGKIDVYVNAHGIGEGAPAEIMELSTWQRVIDVNLTSAFMCCREVGQVMLAQEHGSIILISSNAGEVAYLGSAAYGASKAGLDHLGRNLALEWADRGVRVNVISPGFMTSHMRGTEAYYDDPEFVAQTVARTPMKRKGDPRELIGAAVFLASGASSFVTGHIIPVDGGWMLE